MNADTFNVVLFALTLCGGGVGIIALCRKWAYFELGFWATWVLLAPLVVMNSKQEWGWFLLFKSFFLWFLVFAMAVHRSAYQIARNRHPELGPQELLEKSALARFASSSGWNWLGYLGVIGNALPLLMLDILEENYLSLPGDVALILCGFLPLFAPIVRSHVIRNDGRFLVQPFRLRIGIWWPTLFTVWYLPFLLWSIPGAVVWAIFHALVPVLACLWYRSEEHWGYFRIHTLALTQVYSMVISLFSVEVVWPSQHYIPSDGTFGGMSRDAIDVLTIAHWIVIPFAFLAFGQWILSTSRQKPRPSKGVIVDES